MDACVSLELVLGFKIWDWIILKIQWLTENEVQQLRGK